MEGPTNIWQFMCEAPFLTFFLAIIITDGIVGLIRALALLVEAFK